MKTWTQQVIGLGLLVALPWMLGFDGGTLAQEALSGLGFATAIGCVACLGGGVAILSGGAIATFIWMNTSLVALSGCNALCADAVL